MSLSSRPGRNKSTSDCNRKKKLTSVDSTVRLFQSGVDEVLVPRRGPRNVRELSFDFLKSIVCQRKPAKKRTCQKRKVNLALVNRLTVLLQLRRIPPLAGALEQNWSVKLLRQAKKQRLIAQRFRQVSAISERRILFNHPKPVGRHVSKSLS